MIKYSDIKDVFAAHDLTVYEYNIETIEIIDLPFLVYTVTDGGSFRADSINYVGFLNVSLAIIDETLSFETQNKVEQVFEENCIAFDKQINFDDSERLYTITYTFGVFDDGIEN